jgi:hypothetical protein
MDQKSNYELLVHGTIFLIVALAGAWQTLFAATFGGGLLTSLESHIDWRDVVGLDKGVWDTVFSSSMIYYPSSQGIL